MGDKSASRSSIWFVTTRYLYIKVESPILAPFWEFDVGKLPLRRNKWITLKSVVRSMIIIYGC